MFLATRRQTYQQKNMTTRSSMSLHQPLLRALPCMQPVEQKSSLDMSQRASAYGPMHNIMRNERWCSSPFRTVMTSWWFTKRNRSHCYSLLIVQQCSIHLSRYNVFTAQAFRSQALLTMFDF